MLPYPLEIYAKIGSFLDDFSFVQFSSSCKTLHHLFARECKQKYFAQKLLKLVMAGNYVRVDELLSQLAKSNSDPSFLTTRTSGQEVCGRKWEAISPIEFVAWTGNIYLLMKFFEYSWPIPTIQNMIKQCKEVIENGTENGKFLAPFISLETACKEFNDILNLDPNNKEKNDKNLIQIVGKAQYYLPLVWLNLYYYPTYQNTFDLQLSDLGKKEALLLFFAGNYITGKSVFPTRGNGLTPAGSALLLSSCQEFIQTISKMIIDSLQEINKLTTELKQKDKTPKKKCNVM